MAERNSVLIAEEGASDRLLLATLLQNLGYGVLEADNGADALALYQRERPALVLLAVLMPRLDGLEVARRIRELTADRFVPILFLTSAQDPELLSACLEAGGDDFLTRPYNGILLRAKLNALRRMSEMNQTLARQRDEIARHNHHLLREQEMAKRVFDKVAHVGALDLPNIRYTLSPLAVFNGDVLLASAGPSGNLIVLLGDFTGHGLAAAIGAMPLAQTFYSMVAKGFHVRDIVRELNVKLYDILPVGVFCCAAAVEFDFSENTAQVWNGGLPDGLLYRSGTGACQRLLSRHVPLGIKPGRQFNDTVDVFETEPGDRLFLWSDGILEAANRSGAMFGEQRLLDIFGGGSAPQALFDALNGAVRDFLGDEAQADDLSLVEVCVVARDEFAGVAPAWQEEVAAATAGGGMTDAHGVMEWRLRFELEPDSLRGMNPLPLLLHILMEVPGLRSRSGQLYTLLAELYSNALEHGVLGLDSKLKESAQGFAQYYQQRGQALQDLRAGCVAFDLAYQGNDNGGLLSIGVTDSGDGFDFEALLARPLGQNGYSGRGVALLRKISQRMRFIEPGNQVCLEYVWGQWEREPSR